MLKIVFLFMYRNHKALLHKLFMGKNCELSLLQNKCKKVKIYHTTFNKKMDFKSAKIQI